MAPQRIRTLAAVLAVAAATAACGATTQPLKIRDPQLPVDEVGQGRPSAVPVTELAEGDDAPVVDGRAYGAYLKSQQALQSGDIRSAIRYLQITVRRDPEATQPRLRLAQLLLMVGREDEAGSLLGTLDLDPTTLPPELLEIYVMYIGRAGQGAEAEQALKVALERGVLNPIVLLQWLTTEEHRRPPGELLGFVDELKAIDPDFTILACIEGHLLVRQGEYGDAVDPLNECLGAFPDWLPGMLERGLVAEIQGDEDEARLWYRRVLAQQPGQALATWRLRTLKAGASGPDARDKLKELLAEVRFETALQLAADALQSGDALRAETVLKNLPSELQQRPRVQVLMGPVLERRGEFDAAEANYVRAMTAEAVEIRRIAAIQWVQFTRQRHPEEWESRLRERYEEAPSAALAMAVGLALADGQIKAGIAFLERAAERYPEDAEIRYRLGIAYEQAGRRDDAMAAMEAVIERDPEHADALNFVGYSLAEAGRELDRAEELIRRALELKPNAGYIMDSLGWVLFQRGRADDALPWLEKALEIEGDDPVVLEHLGDAYAVTGRFADAREAYREALALTEDPDMAARLREKILDAKD